jgi:hypothetical protein
MGFVAVRRSSEGWDPRGVNPGAWSRWGPSHDRVALPPGQGWAMRGIAHPIIWGDEL